VIYANGGEDPWRWASATHSLGPTQPLVVADCYECGHCVDLHAPNATADAPSLVAARAQIAAFVAQLFDGAIRPLIVITR
jgi:hypothetical protein